MPLKNIAKAMPGAIILAYSQIIFTRPRHLKYLLYLLDYKFTIY
jgi:hypothetical protein